MGHSASPDGASLIRSAAFMPEEHSMRRSALVFLMIAACTLAACNTVRGVGRDVGSVGKTIEKTTR